MKLPKDVVARRVSLMEDVGIEFRLGTDAAEKDVASELRASPTPWSWRQARVVPGASPSRASRRVSPRRGWLGRGLPHGLHALAGSTAASPP